MTEMPGTDNRSASDAELRSIVEAVLHRHFGTERGVTHMECRLSDFRSSFMLDEIDVWLDDGATLQLILKDLSWRALLQEAQGAKPAFLYDPLREIAVYQKILRTRQFGVATCYGAVVDRAKDRYWLFLERVAGLRLAHVGDFDIWQNTARWLAGLHGQFVGQADLLAKAAPLVRYDGDFYLLWMRRTQQFARGRVPKQHGVEWLAERYEQVIERLVTLPKTFIHGEFCAPNVLVGTTTEGSRVCPVDWEMAAVGPGMIDLAALTSGKWSEEQRLAMAMAYYGSLPSGSELRLPLDVFLDALDFCHLHLAVQWLGWSRDWVPPLEHEHDWLGEAMRLAKKLGL